MDFLYQFLYFLLLASPKQEAHSEWSPRSSLTMSASASCSHPRIWSSHACLWVCSPSVSIEMGWKDIVLLFCFNHDTPHLGMSVHWHFFRLSHPSVGRTVLYCDEPIISVPSSITRPSYPLYAIASCPFFVWVTAHHVFPMYYIIIILEFFSLVNLFSGANI